MTKAVEIMNAAKRLMEVEVDRNRSVATEREFYRIIDLIETYKPCPTYHELRLAERFQAEAREFARTARVYRERAIDGKRYVMSHRLDTMMAANNATKAADFARRARLLMGVEP